MLLLVLLLVFGFGVDVVVDGVFIYVVDAVLDGIDCVLSGNDMFHFVF